MKNRTLTKNFSKFIKLCAIAAVVALALATVSPGKKADATQTSTFESQIDQALEDFVGTAAVRTDPNTMDASGKPVNLKFENHLFSFNAHITRGSEMRVISYLNGQLDARNDYNANMYIAYFQQSDELFFDGQTAEQLYHTASGFQDWVDDVDRNVRNFCRSTLDEQVKFLKTEAASSENTKKYFATANRSQLIAITNATQHDFDGLSGLNNMSKSELVGRADQIGRDANTTFANFDDHVQTAYLTAEATAADEDFTTVDDSMADNLEYHLGQYIKIRDIRNTMLSVASLMTEIGIGLGMLAGLIAGAGLFLGSISFGTAELVLTAVAAVMTVVADIAIAGGGLIAAAAGEMNLFLAIEGDIITGHGGTIPEKKK